MKDEPRTPKFLMVALHFVTLFMAILYFLTGPALDKAILFLRAFGDLLRDFLK